MKAIQIAPAEDLASQYSVEHPATSLALRLRDDVPQPRTSNAGDVLIHVKATTVVRDNLTWPELYSSHPAGLGNDFSGIVVSVHDAPQSDSPQLKPGDEVYGMLSAERGGAWAEYIVAKSNEVSLKPADLSWEEAAAMPLSALTADQALFEHANLKQVTPHGEKSRRVLVTGAGGCVGLYLVQMASLAGHHVVGASSSNVRNKAFLTSIGASESVEYSQLMESDRERYDVIIDTVGGDVLARCWALIAPGGHLISIDSASWDFVRRHREAGVDAELREVDAKFFIVEPSRKSMQRISDAISQKGLRSFVSCSMPIEAAKAAYERGQAQSSGRGRIVLNIS